MGTLAQLQQRSAEGQVFQKLVRIAPTTNKFKVCAPTHKLQVNQSNLASIIQPSSLQQQNNQKSYNSPPILDHTGARKRHEVMTVESDYAPE